MIISVENNLDKLPQTLYSYLSNSVTAAGTAIPVKNTNSFSGQDAVQIGKSGEEQSEIFVTSGVSGTTLLFNSGSLRFDHSLDTPVFNIRYNSIVILRSTSGTSGTATAFATVSITPDSLYTQYDDTSGASTYAYKTQYINTISGNISSESDWWTPAGLSYYSLGKIRQRIKDRLYNSNYLKSDDVINDWINEWLEELNTAAIKVNKDYLLGTTSFSFGTAGLGTITTSDFMYPRKIEITTDGENWTPTTEMPLNRFSDQDTFSSIFPFHSWQGDTVIKFLPTGSTGTARMTYSKGEAVLNDDADELPYPMRRYSRSFVKYGLYCAYENDNKIDLSNANYSKTQKDKSDFISEITPRDQTGAKMIDLLEPLSARNEDIFW